MRPGDRSKLVVVVEHDEAIRKILCDMVASIGFQVLSCSSGIEALQIIREHHPSAVTLDLHLPGIDGVEVLDRLASDGATASVPVVIVSAYSSDRRLRSREQVKAIVPKPFDVGELCRQVELAAGGLAA